MYRFDGQVEIMLLSQSSGPGSTCTVNNSFFFFSLFFLQVSFYDKKDMVKNKVLFCKITKELSATYLTQIFCNFCNKTQPRTLVVQLQCVITYKIHQDITGSCGGQLEIMLLSQSSGPGSTCTVNNSFFFFSLFFWKYPFMTKRTW